MFSSRWTLLFPLVVPPSSNGWTYRHRDLPVEPHVKPTTRLHAPELAEGLISPQSTAENGHAHGSGHTHASRYVMGDEEGLTDDEEGGGGWMD